MEWIISNRKRELTIAVLVAVAAFSTVFLLTGAIMTQVYGIYPGDPGFAIYPGPGGKDLTPYNNFIYNACLTAPYIKEGQPITMDTKGLEESGMLFYDPNTCFDMAKDTAQAIGYVIDKVEPYKMLGPYGTETDQMKITLVKKP